MKHEVKKLLILNLPYLLFVYLFDKIGAGMQDKTGRYFLYQVYRSCPGTAVRHYACLHTTF